MEGGSNKGEGRGRSFKPKASYFLPKPVKVGDVVDVTIEVGDVLNVAIEATASKGDGIAKKDGFVIFVKGAKKGDTVNVKIVEVKPRFALAEIVAQ